MTEKRGRSQPSKDDRYTLKRYSEFHTAATYVARAFAAMPCVKRIALFCLIAATPTSEHDRRGRRRIHIPKDVDLAVWVDDTSGLDRLRVLCGRALNQSAFRNGDRRRSPSGRHFPARRKERVSRPLVSLQRMPEAQTSVSSRGLRQDPVSTAARRLCFQQQHIAPSGPPGDSLPSRH